MTQFERAFGEFALLVILVALVVSAGAGLSSYRRDRHVGRALARTLLAGSLVCAAGVALQPAPGPAGVEFVPFTNLDSPSGSDQLLANLFLMIPSGFALGLLRPVRQAVLTGVTVCGVFEILQLVPLLGRVAATEDFLLNAAGFTIGTTVARVGVSGWLRTRRTRIDST